VTATRSDALGAATVTRFWSDGAIASTGGAEVTNNATVAGGAN